MDLVKKWRNGLRAKLLLVGFVPLGLLILISAGAIINLDKLSNEVVGDFEVQSDMIRQSGQMESALNAMGRWVWLSYATKTDLEKQKIFIGNTRKEIQKLNTIIIEFTPFKKSKEVEEKFAAVQSKWKLASEAVEVGLKHFEQGKDSDQEEGKTYILKNATPLLVPITHELQDITKLIEDHSHVVIAAQKASTNKSIVILIILSAIASIWIVIFTLYLARNLVKVFANFSTTLTQSSEDLGTTSAHMSSISFELSQTATSQAAALSQISASLEEITAMVGKNADNSKLSADESTNAVQRAHVGQDIVGKLVSSIEDINSSNNQIMNTVTVSNEKFNDIIKVIKEIETKTKVINDIVFQTKLLSFNASVEAARAGEHGTGFAVVAQEVGKLAEMSGRSANEISQMLTSSVNHVQSIVQESQQSVSTCINEGNTKVVAGMKIANECRTVLTEVSDSIQKASYVANEISVASEEQKIGVAEILKAVNQLDTITHKNAQMSTEAAQSAKQLEGHADSVNKTVNQFMYVLDGDALKITRFPWSDKLLLDVDDMDNQHKVLVEKMDTFFHYLDNGTLPQMQHAFKELADATVFHFKEEEKFLASINYPGLSGHKKIHADLVNTVLKHGDELNRGVMNKYLVSDFLKNWLSVHIMGQDQHYSRFYHKKY